MSQCVVGKRNLELEKVSLFVMAELEAKKYKLELDEDRIKTYISGLDSGIKFIAQQLLQGNSAIVLRQLLPKLIDINNELQYLDKLIDETDFEEQKDG